MKVTTYPMLHIGHESFYHRTSEDLSRCRYVLHEGVSWRSGDQRRPLYDLIARNVGLAAQATALKFPNAATRINLDMSRSEFRQQFFRLPLRYVIGVMFLRYLLWLLTFPRPLRRQFIRHGLLRRRHLREMRDDTPLDELIIRARDRRIVENLRRFYSEYGATSERSYCGIVFGAEHMPAICAGLRGLGFQPGTRRWTEVFRLPFENPAEQWR